MRNSIFRQFSAAPSPLRRSLNISFQICRSARNQATLLASTSKLETDTFTGGLGFNGSSNRGWQAIKESDMAVMPDPNTAAMDPFPLVSILSIIGSIEGPTNRQTTRGVAPSYLKSIAWTTSITALIRATQAWIAPRTERP